MGKRGRRLNQKINKRDQRGWMIPREDTLRRQVYDLLLLGKDLNKISETLDISYAAAVMHKRCITKTDRVNALKYNAEHPDNIVPIPGDHLNRFRRALIEIEHNSTDPNAAATARAALAIADSDIDPDSPAAIRSMGEK